jgi:hypothetical protein
MTIEAAYVRRSVSVRASSIQILVTILILGLIPSISWGQDYQYQYFAKDKDKENKVPFSDYIPRSRLHWDTVPHYVEDYYLLYGMKQYYDENSLRMNIERLTRALETKFRHPSQALVKVETEEEYEKYKNLLLMHINYLMMRDTLKIAAQYDKQKIYFYNLDFAQTISDSLDIADTIYGEALPYWQETKRYAEKASRYKITTRLSYMESERYMIIHGETDFAKTIADYKAKIKKKKAQLAKGLASGG